MATGVYRGSSVLISGTAGTGKSTLAAQFCAAACARGERALYFAFEESAAQIVRNMASVGIDLAHWVDAGLLQFRCIRPSLLGLEAHLASMQELVSDFAPDVVVMDPISDLLHAGGGEEVSAMLTRQVDYLKSRGVTALFTSLNTVRDAENSEQHIGSLIDTWIIAKLAEGDGVAQPGALRAQVAGDGALARDPGVRAQRRTAWRSPTSTTTGAPRMSDRTAAQDRPRRGGAEPAPDAGDVAAPAVRRR